jgi:hypothetical protein
MKSFLFREDLRTKQAIGGEGARVLDVETAGGSGVEGAEYDARIWQEPLMDDEIPQLDPRR